MSTPVDPDGWRQVDEGWGRRAADFATLAEPANAREYVVVHHALGLQDGDRVLDLACGSGLALELASLRGCEVAGIDASRRLVAVARHRLPGADVRVGDMHALPWPDASFDVVTSFRGIWGTTPAALDEARRVLVPGGRLGITVWGHIKASPGAWALAPFRLATEAKVANQAAMVSLGRPGVGEELLARHGFTDVRRTRVPFAFEFADPETYARALASTGPAYEAIQAVGEEEFHRYAVEVAAEHVADGLPLRAEIDVVGYLARTPTEPAGTADAWPYEERSGSFLGSPPRSHGTRVLYDDDVETMGFVMNASRTWGHGPQLVDALFDLLGLASRTAGLSFRERAVLVLGAASTMGDSYCSLAWGTKLARATDADLPAAVLTGTDAGLDAREAALATWARRVARDPNGATDADVAALRRAGFDDAQVLALTTFTALRLAFSIVNDALGATPDEELLAEAPAPVRSAVTWGRGT